MPIFALIGSAASDVDPAVPTLWAALFLHPKASAGLFESVRVATSGGGPAAGLGAGSDIRRSPGDASTRPMVCPRRLAPRTAARSPRARPRVRSAVRCPACRRASSSTASRHALIWRLPSARSASFDRRRERHGWLLWAACADRNASCATAGCIPATWPAVMPTALLHRRPRGRSILTSAYNVYPSEIESLLATHEAVSEAAVIGKPDRLRGQVVWAYVVLKEGETATGRSCLPTAGRICPTTKCRGRLSLYPAFRTTRRARFCGASCAGTRQAMRRVSGGRGGGGRWRPPAAGRFRQRSGRASPRTARALRGSAGRACASHWRGGSQQCAG